MIPHSETVYMIVMEKNIDLDLKTFFKINKREISRFDFINMCAKYRLVELKFFF